MSDFSLRAVNPKILLEHLEGAYCKSCGGGLRITEEKFPPHMDMDLVKIACKNNCWTIVSFGLFEQKEITSEQGQQS